MDPLVVILTIVICVFAVVLVVAGIQVILVLQEIKTTLRKINVAAESIEKAAHQAVLPLANLGGTVDGIKSGLKIVQAFTSWLSKEKSKD